MTSRGEMAGSQPSAYVPFFEEEGFSPVGLRIWYDMNYIFLNILY